MQAFTLTSLTRGLRWQDALDIALLTLLFSSVYRWLRRTVALQEALGVATVLLASWIASHLGLILTSYLLSAVGAVATIAIVVVFQNEIRKGLSRVSPVRWLSRGRGHPAPADARATVSEAAFAIADRRKGALIVIPRDDAVFEHTTAGTVVDARLSAQVIEAIFTSTSPLHDGAIVVNDTRVLRAGVVLPLATEENEDPVLGTRHRAAMGLARATDALVVCVSEERGSVCLVHGEALEPMANEIELRAALRRLGGAGGRARGAQSEQAPPRRRLAEVAPHAAIFVGVVLAWSALALDRSHAVSRVVALQIRNVSEGIALDPARYTSVVVELRGSRRELEQLSDDAVDAYVDLKGTPLGLHTFRVLTQAPAGIEVASAMPASVSLLIRPRLPPAAAASVPVPAPREPAALPDLHGRARPAPRH